MTSVRRLAAIFLSRCANRRFAFAIASAATVGAKVIHVYAHFAALSTIDILRWGPSFFTQDVALLLLLRLLLDKKLFSTTHLLIQLLAPTVAALIVTNVLALACVSISFFTIAGSELHWRNVVLASDSSSWTTLLTGLMSFSLVLCCILLAGWVFQDTCYMVATTAIDMIKWPFNFVLSKLPARHAVYTRLTEYDSDSSSNYGPKKDDDLEKDIEPTVAAPSTSSTSRILVTVGMIWLSLTSVLRPDDSSLIFMSWTLPLLPLLDFTHSSPNLASLVPFYDTGIGHEWDNITALDTPIPFPWLPEEPLAGFEDWYDKDVEFYNGHYNAAADPLRISNLDDDLLPGLKESLPKARIRHIMLIKLESTRKDVFPLKKDGLIWQKLMKTYENDTVPDDVRKMLSDLTPTARFLTGDHEDGLEHTQENTKKRGGINANKVFTTSTYTLKSIAGTLCGISPLVGDFNAECGYHIYQPCLPHILEAFNKLEHKHHKTTDDSDDFKSYPWRSWWMQSVTGGFDRQDRLMPAWGFNESNIITKEYLQGDNPKFGNVTMEDVNYYGMPEIAIEDYVRDAFKTANEENERVFLTHLTSTAHHPFGLPKDEDHPYVSLTDDDDLQNLSKYLNAIHYVDGWLQKILGILKELNVADETLLVAVGDHGLSVAENGGLTPYYNENVGNFHVPLVLSHPKLPSVDVNDPVTSSQILPTILDLLLETDSLSTPDGVVARDLLNNYEGQTLLRPQHASSPTGEANWQFTVLNPGRAELAIRDARHPNWKLIVPVIEDTEWRFVDLATDAHEEDPILSFVFRSFLELVAEKHDVEAAKWVEEAAFMCRWWVDENARRWRWL